MELPERFVGYVEDDSDSFAFEFDQDAFKLKLYPLSKNDDSDGERILKFFQTCEEKGNLQYGKDKNTKIIKGTLNEQFNVLFQVFDNRKMYYGFPSYDVKWLFCYPPEASENHIKSFHVRGKDINYFYPPYIAYEARRMEPEDKSSRKTYAIITKK